MVTRRALLVYNFGIAIILAAVGFLTSYAMIVTQESSRLTGMPTFDAPARLALEGESEIEKLRARSLFYLELAYELKKSQRIDVSRLFYDARTLAFMVSGLFVLGEVLVLVLSAPVKNEGGT